MSVTGTTPATTRSRPRYGFTFAADGRSAAALRADPGGGLTVETWRPTASGWAPRPTGVPADLDDQLLPLSDGRLLLVRPDDAGATVLLVDPRADGGCTVELCRRPEHAVRLAPPPPGEPTALACLIGYDGTVTRFWWLLPDGSLAPIGAPLPGLTSGQGWLPGPRLALTWTDPAGLTRVLALDPRTGVTSTLLDVDPGTDDRVALADPGSDLLVVTTNAGDAEWVGFARPGSGGDPWFPEELAAEERAEALAVDPTGRYVLLHRRRGAHAELTVHDVPGGSTRPLATPPGCPRGPAAWTADGIVLPWSAPTVPHATVHLDPAGPPPVLADHPGTVPARTVTLDGAAGPVQGVVHGGGPDWRRAGRLLVALHGGPHARWSYTHDPLLQALAADGVAVLALNQRGSTGYGRAHALAVVGAWGGPDLADVLAVLDGLAAHRRGLPPPAVLGLSYGGFLALLTGAMAGDRIGGCVALAAFTSARRLHRDGSAGVRALIDDLAGHDGGHDGWGERDVLRLADRLTAPTLLVHGARDGVVPVAESRRLHRLLRGLGRRPTYLEIDGAGHQLTHGATGERVVAAVRDFLTAPAAGRRAGHGPPARPHGARGDREPTDVGGGDFDDQAECA